MIAILIMLFWIVGVVTGIIATIFFLELEEKYIFEPARSLLVHTLRLYAKITSPLRLRPKRALQRG